jgi:predicted esterase
MKIAVPIASVLLMLVVPIRAQDPKPPEKGGSEKTAPAKTSAQAFADEFSRGVQLLIAKDWAGGMAAMHHCLEIQPESPECAYNLACAHALQGQIEDGIAWWQKCADWGYGYSPFQDAVDHADKDTDLDPLRKDERFTAAMEKIRTRTKATEEYIATPAVYVPKSLEAAAEMPLLVVLHAAGTTKESVVAGRWKTVADELGAALVAPSGRVLTARDPKAGMAWYVSFGDYTGGLRLPAYEKTVTAAVDAFGRAHKVDSARVWIAGDVEGGIVATRLAFAYPKLYKGAVAVESPLVLSLVQSKAGPAAKEGLKFKLLIDKDAFAKRLAADPTQPPRADKLIADWTEQLSKLGFPDALEVWTKDASATPYADQARAKIVAVLRAMQPAAVEAAAPK